jgi:hypothetical protein
MLIYTHIELIIAAFKLLRSSLSATEAHKNTQKMICCQYLAGAALLAAGILALRVLQLMFGPKRPLPSGSGPVKTMIVLGSGAFFERRPAHTCCCARRACFVVLVPPLTKSLCFLSPTKNIGGHTAEMLALVRRLDRAHYAPRAYVAAATDRMSGQKALALEAEWAGDAAAAAAAAAAADIKPDGGSSGAKQQQQRQRGGGLAAAGAAAAPPAVVIEIPRSREVGQSYLTSVGTTLYSLAFAAWAVARERPRMVGRFLGGFWGEGGSFWGGGGLFGGLVFVGIVVRCVC